MKKTRYQIKMRSGEERTVEGEIVNDIWGIDKRMTQKTTYTKNGEEKVSQSSDYFLTHVPSGTLITNARTKRALMEIANLPIMIDQNNFQLMMVAVNEYWESKGWKD